ncbi:MULTISPECIES: arylsulfatase [unclassified Lentimonas]|uniref:arylsulfatase n=1 Tax=unclassified Lentimonas TaxID=2630993 RepID=UPI0013220D62|nr:MULTISPECIES: arylsulfatase [unclassified Lentimonas]CAA6677741.1 Unannotated [Lentimonas sp. CC4]CAA6685005.1 Unannotated [Lentimonas sp. CC6]CAA6691705.1 Unannotated [Lentimonas sp. CC19]CAA6696043.1 Unannotated [Lentimonas sp. CC10]CAA7070059.1 Unannotated [Lentimonas sp. CC11]
MKLYTNPLKLTLSLGLCFMSLISAHAADRPNVILIITDDQGYGDIGAHGNPILKTPNLDKLHSESLRFTDFHSSPFCTPTRAAVMTGRYPERTAAFRTSSGRTLMHPDEVTMPEIFAANGYATGLVGKWHLGDNAPHRPQDRGFQEVLWHKAGGVGQGPDYWGNRYFNDTYERIKAGSKQGSLEKFAGYCTDVWFSEAADFVERHQDAPFFLYLATNAPHSPYIVGEEWSAPYRDIEEKSVPEFFGMIANLDHNLGLLRQHLQDLGLAENTILIFMSDNGTAKGRSVYNADMKGGKSSIFDGGHRIPFFFHWPKGDLASPQDVPGLAAHLDILPTLADLCGLKLPKAYAPDGVTLTPILKDPKATSPRDIYVVQYHGGVGLKEPIEAWNKSAVIADRWRLIEGEELFDIKQDPGQRKDVAAEYPEVVERLRAEYLPWWKSVSPRMTIVRIDLGNPDENPVHLNSQDWVMQGTNPPWSQGAISRRPKVTGPWMVDVKKAGTYQFTLRQRPEEAPEAIQAVRAKIEIAGQNKEVEIPKGANSVVFTLDLPVGEAELITYFYDKKGNAGGAYYTEVEAL